MSLPPWVLNEPVDVTCVYRERDDETLVIYLVARVEMAPIFEGGVAVTLTFSEDGLLVNGLPYVESRENEFWDLCGLVDDAGHWASPDGVMPVGKCVRSVPIPS